MPKSLFRVKRYSHPKYKFVARAKIGGKWKRRYFCNEDEAIAFAEHQNAHDAANSSDVLSQPNGDGKRPATQRKTVTEWSRPERSAITKDLSKLVSPAYLGPRIQHYIGDSWCMHLPFAYDLMRELAPKVFVELGVKEGESYFAFCQSAAENKINVKCYGVDSWQGDIQTGPLDSKIQEGVMSYNWRYSSFSELKPMLFAEAVADFPDASIELLHIDGTHTYNDVKSDFESWLPKVAPNGLILFHDVMLRDGGFGVWKVWEEIAREDNSFLFEFGFGLGVWKKQPVTASDPSFVRRLFLAREPERRDINESYANDAASLALWHNLSQQFASKDQDLLFTNEAQERTTEIAEFQRRAEKQGKQAAQAQLDLEEKSEQVRNLQRELEEKTSDVVRFRREFEEKSSQLALLRPELEAAKRLERDLKKSANLAAVLQHQNDQQAQLVNDLKNQLERDKERSASAGDELLDARWENLTLRGKLLRERTSTDPPSARLLHLQTIVEAITSERDHLRTMLVALQNDLEKEGLVAQARQQQTKEVEAELRATKKLLLSEQKERKRRAKSLWGKLILRFGKPQRRLRELTAGHEADD